MINCWLFTSLLISHVPIAVLWQKTPLAWNHLSQYPSKYSLPYYEDVAGLIENCKKDSQTYIGKETAEILYSLLQTAIKLFIAEY